MKKKVRFLSGLCLVGLLLISCSIDDNNTMKANIKTTNNYLKVGNVKYDLSAGLFENYGVDYNNKLYHGYSTDLMLYSKDLSLQKNEKGFFMFAGKGNAIHFEMFSTSGKEFDNQEYVFSSHAPYQVNTFGNATYILNLDFDFKRFYTIETKDKSEIVDGKVSVAKVGDKYSITIDCVCDNGLKVTGKYTGTLPYIDWTVFDM